MAVTPTKIRSRLCSIKYRYTTKISTTAKIEDLRSCVSYLFSQSSIGNFHGFVSILSTKILTQLTLQASPCSINDTFRIDKKIKISYKINNNVGITFDTEIIQRCKNLFCCKQSDRDCKIQKLNKNPFYTFTYSFQYCLSISYIHRQAVIFCYNDK